jgi:hypothetical protein
VFYWFVHKKISGVTLCTLATLDGKRGALPQPQGTPQYLDGICFLAMSVMFCVRCKGMYFFM